jgi:CHC2 zinc finger/Toprim-like
LRSTSPPRLTLASLVPRDVFGALQALGIDAEERGDEAVALCPNPDHRDRSPSWSCNLDSGQHHCFACGFGGSFVYLVGCMLGKTRADSEGWVRDRKLKDVAEGDIGPRVAAPKRAIEVSEADMWRFTEPPAQARAERGLTLNACTMYDVRWDNDDDLWITAVRDKHGKLLGWQAKNGRRFHNHPKHLVKSKSLFGWGLVPAGGTVLLVESPLDAPYALPGCPGDVIPVSSYGASVSREQVNLIASRAGRVILAMDNDEAGWRSVAKLAWAFESTSVLVFAYPDSATLAPVGPVDIAPGDGRDPGNLTMDEVSYGIEHAIPAWRIRIPWL